MAGSHGLFTRFAPGKISGIKDPGLSANGSYGLHECVWESGRGMAAEKGRSPVAAHRFMPRQKP